MIPDIYTLPKFFFCLFVCLFFRMIIIPDTGYSISLTHTLPKKVSCFVFVFVFLGSLGLLNMAFPLTLGSYFFVHHVLNSAQLSTPILLPVHRSYYWTAFSMRLLLQEILQYFKFNYLSTTAIFRSL